MREALLIGAAPGDGTGDPARTGGQKVNDNFAELYAFLGGDSLPTPLTTLAFSGDIADATGTLAVGQGGTGSTTLTAGSVLLGNGTGALSSFATTAGRLVIGNGGSGLTDDANLTWDATNGLTVRKNISSPGPGTGDETYGALSKIWQAGGSNTAFGYNARVGTSGAADPDGNSHTVIGSGAFVGNFAYFNTVVGAGANASAAHCVSVGTNTSSSQNNTVCVGDTARVTVGSVGAVGAIGASTTQGHKGGMTIGVNNTSEADYELTFGWAWSETGTGSGHRLQGATSAFVPRSMWRNSCTWVDGTDATRKARSVFSIFDTAEREAIRMEANGAAMLGFFGATAVVQPSGTGETVGFTAGTGTTVHDDSTFTGNVGATAYRISDVVKALKTLGFMAA